MRTDVKRLKTLQFSVTNIGSFTATKTKQTIPELNSEHFSQFASSFNQTFLIRGKMDFTFHEKV